jgi:hypothetical protein
VKSQRDEKERARKEQKNQWNSKRLKKRNFTFRN